MGEQVVIHVMREATGLTVEITAPRLAKFLHAFCKQQSGLNGPSVPDQSDLTPLGPMWPSCSSAGFGPAVKALNAITRWRGSDGAFVEYHEDAENDSIPNLFLLRAAAAKDGPVKYIFRGLHSTEMAKLYQDRAVAIIKAAYSELTGTYDKTTTINVEAASAPSVRTDPVEQAIDILGTNVPF